MPETIYAICSNFFVIVFLTVFINFCTSAPVNITQNTYSQFVTELNRDLCSVPTQVQLPFNATKANSFEYLSSYLEICQKTQSTRRNKEAVVLCKEIFDNVRNISCPPQPALPDMIMVNLSGNVCQDIGALKESVPEDDRSLLKRLTDGIVCEIMCDTEFEKACQVLLWSFQVQKQIASVASAQEPEKSNVPGHGGDTNLDSFKQDNAVAENALPEIPIVPENEKLHADVAKDVNEVAEHNGDAEGPDPGKSGEDPEQRGDTLLVPGTEGKQEKPVPNDQEVVSENQPVPEDKGQDSASASKSTSSTKTPSSVTQQKSDAQASNTEMKPLDKTTKTEFSGQNENKQLLSDVIKYEEVNIGAETPQGSNTNIVLDEKTQDVKDNTLADRAAQDKKDTDIPLGDEDKNSGNEMSEKGDQNTDFSIKNGLPHDSANGKSLNDAAADLHNDEENPSNLVIAIDQNKPSITTNHDDDLAEKMNSSTSNSQTTKDTTQQQIVQETIHDKTNIAKDETEVGKSVTNSIIRKGEEIQDHTKTNSIIHNLTTDSKTKNPSSDKKKPKGALHTEKFDNTIPDSTEKPIISDQKQPEKSQKLKPTALNPEGISVIISSLTETSTKPTAALEKMEGGTNDREPADEEAEHYGDQENTEGDEYPVPDYDVGFGDISKSKAPRPDFPGPVTAAKESITSPIERPMEFPSRNRFGQDSSDVQMISAFPEQEDGHFFFYFLSIVLILMAGYLIFHNKQKIIALIVEGRHERNRRSHRIGYKKLETK